MEQKHLINPMRKLTDEERQMPVNMPPERTPEEVTYVILAVFKEDAREQTFRICLGRSEAAEEARLLVLDDADLNESRVFTDRHTINDAISLYWFMKRMMELGLITDTSFDIDDYMEGDSNETVLEANQEDLPEQVSAIYNGEADDSDKYNI